MKCSKCGTENMDSMAFCTVCGTILAADNSAPPPPPAPVQNADPAVNPAQFSAPTAVADPVYNAPQTMAPDPMQGLPMGPGPMQGPPMMPPPPPILECGQCKKPFGPDEPFCTNCGAPRQMAISRPASVPGAKKGAKTAIIIAIAIVVLIGAAFGVYALIRENNYNSAVDQMNMGNYQVAYEAFEKLGDYKNSMNYSDECYLYVRYEEALDLMDEGSYLDAKEIFDELGDFQDSYDMSEDCLNFIDYYKAIDLYDAGKYFEAYKIFESLGEFEDSWDWAYKCIQPTPNSGVIEQGPAHATGSTLLIENNSMYSFCISLYTESGSYWGMVYVDFWSYDDVNVNIAVGIYTMDWVAAFYDDWFGMEDKFGDNGYDLGKVIVDGDDTPEFEITEGGQQLTIPYSFSV